MITTTRRMHNRRMESKFIDTFGKRLRILREDMRWTQDELAERVRTEKGLSLGQNYISELERSNKIPGGAIVAALALALNTTTDYLLLLTNVSVRPDEQDAYFSPEADEAAKLLDRFLPAERQELIHALRQIAHSIRAREADAAGFARDLVASLATVKIILGEPAMHRIEVFVRDFLADREYGGAPIGIIKSLREHLGRNDLSDSDQ